MSKKYWAICVEEAFESAGIHASKDQVAIVVAYVSDGHEMYSEANGHHYIPNPQTAEINDLQVKLEKEKSKRTCKDCRGSGQFISEGPVHSSISQCTYCCGVGRL